MAIVSRIEVNDLNVKDKVIWRALYDGYARFYKREMTDEIAETVWQWLTDDSHELNCLMASYEGKPVGLAHYRPMLRPLHGVYIGYLDDLFVDPQARGLKVGDALFTELKNIAKQKKWGTMRWLTADDNYRARSFYDKWARKSGTNLYEMNVDDR